MTHSPQVRPGAPRILIAAAVLAAWVLTSVGLAQADAITFDVEIVRVDLVRGEDGDVVERFVPVQEAIPGEVIEYRVTATNEGDVIYRPGTVVVTLPIGEGLVYLEDTATPSSDRVVTEFSADGGATYAEPPVLVSARDDEAEPEGDGDGGDEGATRAADPSEYDHIRWTFSVPFEPGQQETLVYRVEVR
jgi:uncharacterized repeat protein (TIGR01451 family)